MIDNNKKDNILEQIANEVSANGIQYAMAFEIVECIIGLYNELNPARWTDEQMKQAIGLAIDIATDVYCRTGINSKESEDTLDECYTEILNQLQPPIVNVN